MTANTPAQCNQHRWSQRWTARLHRRLFGCAPTAPRAYPLNVGDVTVRTKPWSPFDHYPYERVIDIPLDLLPCAPDWSDSVLPVRLCDSCADSWFGIFGPVDPENVGIPGTGDHCACCGYGSVDARDIARRGIQQIVVRSLLAGATPAEMTALVQHAAIEAARLAASSSEKPAAKQRGSASWPQTW